MLFISRKHGLEMRQRCVSKGRKVYVYKYKGHKKEKEQDMNRGHNFYAADKIDIVFKPLDPPEKEAGYHLRRQKDKHDPHVGIFLQGIEFIVRSHLVRVGLSPENPGTVIFKLFYSVRDKGARVGKVEFYLHGSEIIGNP